MTRWRKVKPIAAFELVSTVRTKSWLILTFGMPVLLALYAGLVSIPIYLQARKELQVQVFGLVDAAGVLGLRDEVQVERIEIPPEIRTALQSTGQAAALEGPVSVLGSVVFRPYPDDTAAREALLAGTLRGFFRIPPDYLATGIVDSYQPETGLRGKETRRVLSKLLVERLVRDRLAPEIAARVGDPVKNTRSWIVTRTGEVKKGEAAAWIVRAVVPIVFAVLLMLSILMGAGGLIQATAIEKENKVVEVLVSSANPDEILMGKLLSQGIAGTIQMSVWFGMAAIAGAGFLGTLAAIGIEPPWVGMAAAVVFFPLAYLFYGSLMLGTGSIGATQKEANQWGMIWSLLMVVPLVLLESLLDAPNGTLARVLTFVPFSTATTVILRLTIDPAGIAWWEIAGSILVLIVSIYFTIRIGARLFRVGLLLTGARPRLREILRQARLG